MQKKFLSVKRNIRKNFTSTKNHISSENLQDDTSSDWWFFDNYVKERLKAHGVTM
jgi:hypothetical protein